MRHGLSKSPTYRTWSSMKTRCYCASVSSFHRYGGRGIKVCKRWMSFANFLADMGERPPGMSIDRINNDGNYEPGNCRWATPKQQMRNTARARRITVDGVSCPVMDVAERLTAKAPPTVVASRLFKGMAIDRAVTLPSMSQVAPPVPPPDFHVTQPGDVQWSAPIRQAIAKLVSEGEPLMSAVAMAIDGELEARRRARVREQANEEGG